MTFTTLRLGKQHRHSFIFKKNLPFFTCSPSETTIEGRIPTYSSPNNATRRIAGPSSITWAGAPQLGGRVLFNFNHKICTSLSVKPKLQIHPENVATL